MTRLSVNVNKLATLRNSRGKNLPDVLALSKKILSYGVHGLTMHPRPDGRHIRTQDVVDLHDLVEVWNQEHDAVEFNVEGFPSAEYLQLVGKYTPTQATLVPDPPEALTSNAGWDLKKNKALLLDLVGQLRSQGIRVSLFVDPFTFDEQQEVALKTIAPDRIELYTEKFADAFETAERASVCERYAVVARKAVDMGIGVNAGHDLNQRNLGYLIEQIPMIEEVSIGHALICEALEEGLATTIANYLRILKPK